MNARLTHRLSTRLLALAGLSAALVLTGVAPAAEPVPVGDRINVFAGTPTTYPAGQPFHIRHGWSVGITAHPEQTGLWRFSLDVDGVPRAADDTDFNAEPAPTTGFDAPRLNRGWIFNFPAGMTGRHTFTGHWIGPCELAVESGYPGPCNRPNEPVEALTRSLTVDFVRTNLALGRPVTASREYPGSPASLAVDGSWWTYWNSGDFPPQWIEVDLESVQSVSEIDLGITQLPDSQTTHRIYGRASGSEPFQLLHEFSGFTVDQQVLQYLAGTPQQVRYIRVETTSSWSWVAWREIEVYAAGS